MNGDFNDLDRRKVRANVIISDRIDYRGVIDGVAGPREIAQTNRGNVVGYDRIGWTIGCGYAGWTTGFEPVTGSASINECPQQQLLFTAIEIQNKFIVVWLGPIHN